MRGSSAGLIKYETMGGISYEHDERLFNNNPNEHYKIRFTIPRPAQVEIQENGSVMRRLYLPAGSHEISGFSGNRGLNNVQVFITQEDGAFEIIPYEFEVGDAGNLRKGEISYSVSAGARRYVAPTGFDYKVKEPGFNANALYGITPFITGGLNGQASKQNIMAGPQILLSSDSLSWLELSALASYADSFGHSEEIKYTQKLNSASISITGYHRSEAYNPNLFGTLSHSNSEYLGISGSAGLTVPRGGISVSAGITKNRRVKGLEYSSLNYGYGASVSQTIYDISFNANANAIVRNGEFEPYISFGASYAFGVSNHSFVIMDEISRNSVYVPPIYDVENSIDTSSLIAGFEPELKETPGYSKYEWQNMAAIGWNWSDGNGYNGARSYSAYASMQENFNSARISAQHAYNRARISAAYNLMDMDIDNITMRNHSVNATMGASFMFADGLWAFGRPVDRGFILANVQNGLKGSAAHINHSEYFNNDYSESGWLGSAYYNQVTNYRPNEIKIDLTDIPLGSWLEQDKYYTMGAYKQGYALRLGSDANVLLQARLVDEAGQLAYKYVSVERLDSKGGVVDKRATFTSKDGILQAGNLHPGSKYRLNFATDSYIKAVNLDIPRGSGALIVLPDIKVEYEELSP